MSLTQVIVAFFGMAITLRVAGKITRRWGLRGGRAVGAAFVLAELLGFALELAMASIDDQYGDFDFPVDAAIRTACLAPWLVSDVLRLSRTDDPYERPIGRAGRALVYVPYGTFWGFALLGWIGCRALRPMVEREAIQTARDADDYADECESPAACHETVRVFLARVDRGDITFRTLTSVSFLRDVVRGEDDWMSATESQLIVRYFDLVETTDGQPPDTDELFARHEE